MAKHALGTTFKIGTNAVAELIEIGGVDMSADTIDVTTLSSTDGYRQFVQGLKDAGEVSLSGFFKPDDTNGQAELLDLFDSGDVTAMSIVFPTSLGYTWSFSAIVTGYVTGAALEDAVTFEATLKISGKPTLVATV